MHKTHATRALCSVVLLCAGVASFAACTEGYEPPSADVDSDEATVQASEVDTDAISGGMLYAGTNAARNGVARFRRHADGRLEFREITLTGGSGTDGLVLPTLTARGPDPLLSQHSVAMNAAHTVLMVVNTGDDTVTSFRVSPSGALTLASRVESGGHYPNTIAIRRNVAYVGNAGNALIGGVTGNVVGFRIGRNGELHRIPGAEGTFADPGAEPAHVLFTPDGTRLVVTELFTKKIDIFPIHDDGTLGTSTVSESAGGAPFGMTFTSADTLLVSEAEGAVPGAATVSSYHMDGMHLTPVTSTLASGESGACWFSVTPDGRYAYATNTGSADHPSSISIYSVARSGALTFIDVAAVPRTAPAGVDTAGGVDSMVTADGRYLYQLYSGSGGVGAYRIGSDGRLTAVSHGDAGGLPLGTEGLDGF